MGKDEEKQKIDVADLENGPLTEANRECRDVLCCLLFVACCGAMVYLAAYGYSNGNLSNIYQGIDQNTKVCGSASYNSTGGVSYAAYPYLYFTYPLDVTSPLSKRVCVDACPSWDGTAVTQVNCPNQTECTYQFTYSSSGSLVLGSGTITNPSILGYDSTLLLSRVCIPNTSMLTSLFTTIANTFASSVFQSDLNNFISDIKNNYKWLLAATGVAVLIAFIFMFLLRCLAGCIVWLSLFGTIFVLLGLGLIFLYNAGRLTALTSIANYLAVPTIITGYNEPIGWSLVGVSGAFLILVLCCCSRIRLAVAICKSAGQFIAGVCLIVLVPIFQTALVVALWGGCLVGMVYLVSSAQFTTTGATYFTTLADYADYALIRFYVFLFGTLWINAFFGAMGIFVIASACSMWYYSHAPGSELSLPIWRSYKMIFRFHWGSLAFGSLLLAIVQFIQLLVEFFKKQAQASGQRNKCVEYAIKCIECCLACVECIVRFINTQAYIQIALRGKNFCYAAKDGFELVWSNPLRYSIVGGIGNIIMFLGKVAIAATTAFLFYLFITYVQSVRSGYLQPYLQVIVVAVIGFVVGMLFMSVYTVAMDTLLQCFIVDETNQKAKGKGKPQWAPEDLADLMDTEEKENAKQDAK